MSEVDYEAWYENHCRKIIDELQQVIDEYITTSKQRADRIAELSDELADSSASWSNFATLAPTTINTVGKE